MSSLSDTPNIPDSSPQFSVLQGQSKIMLSNTQNSNESNNGSNQRYAVGISQALHISRCNQVSQSSFRPYHVIDITQGSLNDLFPAIPSLKTNPQLPLQTTLQHGTCNAQSTHLPNITTQIQPRARDCDLARVNSCSETYEGYGEGYAVVEFPRDYIQ